MNLRPPAVPLITIDPYFSVWSPADRLTDAETVHWTGRANTIRASVIVDGAEYRFMGGGDAPAMTQIACEVEALTTAYTFEGGGIRLRAEFTSPLLPGDYYLMSRPVSFLRLSAEAIAGGIGEISVRIAVSEEICLNLAGEDELDTEVITHGGLSSVKMGGKKQPVLWRSGDDVRIDWGYFYLSCPAPGRVFTETKTITPIPVSSPGPYRSAAGAKPADPANQAEAGRTMTFAAAESALIPGEPLLLSFAYDDIYSLEYFGERIKSYWNKDGADIITEIGKAHADYVETIARCDSFSDRMFIDAVRAGGEKYAELLHLTYRQAVAAHKLALDSEGNILFVSKECFSNGCAATVDVSYPSSPLFLLYNPELVRGMMRPVYKYAESGEWPYEFAPHDAGRYPLLNGQYYHGTELRYQMPLEECGNMLIMEAAITAASGKADKFTIGKLPLLEKWAEYLIENGADPADQLCTDDFAGHLAGNCNLTLKAVMGIASMGIIYKMIAGSDESSGQSGKKEFTADYLNAKVSYYMTKSREMAAGWITRAANGDGTFRLAYDRPGSFSMKYNMIWDKLYGTGIFPPEVMASEAASYPGRSNPYGMPLDNRSAYTKSDWLVWSASLFRDRADFKKLIAPLWLAYNHTPQRVPSTDWYWTENAAQRGFQNRTVQGGLFIKLLEYSGIMRIR